MTQLRQAPEARGRLVRTPGHLQMLASDALRTTYLVHLGRHDDRARSIGLTSELRCPIPNTLFIEFSGFETFSSLQSADS